MYEDMTYEVILKRALSRVSGTIDKRQGSIVYDAVAPACAEIAQMYIELDRVLNESFADTASREYLIKRAGERGLIPYEATNAVLKGRFDIAVNIGERFNGDDLNYVVTEFIETADGYYCYKLKCETAGAVGNTYVGKLIPINDINGLGIAELVDEEPIIPGEDEESTEAFRQRYMDSLQSQAFGGNVADYKAKVMALDGVGGIKVYKADEWNGAGTVKLVIQSSSYNVPSGELIESLQTAIDPTSNSGEGMGIAPIGHQVTVAGVNSTAIAIQAILTYASGYSWDSVSTYVLSAIREYLQGLNISWADTGNIIVYAMQIGAKLLNIDGILDVADIQLNGDTANLEIDKDSIINVGNSTFNNIEVGGTNE